MLHTILFSPHLSILVHLFQALQSMQLDALQQILNSTSPSCPVLGVLGCSTDTQKTSVVKTFLDILNA